MPVLVAEHLSAGEGLHEVAVGIETDRGRWLAGLIAPAARWLRATRCLPRATGTGMGSRARSDPGDAHVLADLVRTGRHQYRRVAGDRELAESVTVLTWAQENLIQSPQRQVNAAPCAARVLPAALEVFPKLAHRDARAVLALTPGPPAGPSSAGGPARPGALHSRVPVHRRDPLRADRRFGDAPAGDGALVTTAMALAGST